MMKKQNTASAKRKRFITNTIVHVILAVLAVIWVIPIAWIIMISFRGREWTIYFNTHSEDIYTEQL